MNQFCGLQFVNIIAKISKTDLLFGDMYPNMRRIDYGDDKGSLEFHWPTDIVKLLFDFSTFVLFAIRFPSITPKVPFYGLLWNSLSSNVKHQTTNSSFKRSCTKCIIGSLNQ